MMEDMLAKNAESKWESTVCVNFTDGIHAKVMDESGNVLAARNQKNGQVRTDFPVKEKDGSIKWYEENPTKTDPLSGANLLKENYLFKYDPKTDKRGEAISKDSAEYKQANAELAVLRAKYTPLVIGIDAILSLPKCLIESRK